MPRMYFDEESREIVGSGGFKSEPKDRRVEIGYGVSPFRRCRGYATLGVKLLTEAAFLNGLVDEIYAEVSPTNEPSRRVLQKAGFSFSGVGTDDEGPVELWSKKTGPGQAVQPTRSAHR